MANGRLCVVRLLRAPMTCYGSWRGRDPQPQPEEEPMARTGYRVAVVGQRYPPPSEPKLGSGDEGDVRRRPRGKTSHSSPARSVPLILWFGAKAFPSVKALSVDRLPIHQSYIILIQLQPPTCM